MIKLKLMKGILLGACISLLSTGVAFASEAGGGVSSSSREPLLYDKGVTQIEPVASDRKAPDVNESVLKKQAEIDQYVFKDNVDKLKEMGFKVVYTGPADNYVEIGITPYEDKYAEFLYEQFGKDSIKVVEGEQAYLYATTTAASDLDVPVSNETERYVGDDIVLKDGEFGITSIEVDEDEIVNKDSSEIYETGIAELGAEKDYEDNIAETTAVVDDVKRTNSISFTQLLLIMAIAGGLIVITGVVVLNKKKVRR